MHEYFASKTFSNFNSELMCMFENRFLKIMIMANLNSLSGSYSMTFWRSRWWFCFNFCRFVKLCFWNSCPGTLTSQQNGYFSELKTWVWFFLCVCGVQIFQFHSRWDILWRLCEVECRVIQRPMSLAKTRKKGKGRKLLCKDVIILLWKNVSP